MPALALVDKSRVEYAGVAVNSAEERFGKPETALDDTEKATMKKSREKAEKFAAEYGGKVYESYEELVTSEEIDAVYMPLPPALHYKWAKRALESGKHVLLEKPATATLQEAEDLLLAAKGKGLALYENYMFMLHDQISAIDDIIKSGEIGDVRLYRLDFGFPRREATDFRYNKDLGGGTLGDNGGYTVRYASYLLGDTAKVQCAVRNYTGEFDVDLYGSATLTNKEGVTAQLSYGMDNQYRCDLTVWGSTGELKTGRVFTAPAGFTPTVTIKKGNEEETRDLPVDDAFKKTIEYFLNCIEDTGLREKTYKDFYTQAALMEELKK